MDNKHSRSLKNKRHIGKNNFKRNTNRINSSKKIIGILFLTIGISILISLIYVLVKVYTLDKFIVVDNNSNSVEILIVDPQNEKFTKIKLPDNLEMSVARGMGEYKSSAIWSLSNKSEYGGRIVAETVSKNLGIPVYLWRDGKKGNISLIQRIRLALDKSKFNDIDVADMESFSVTKMKDGEDGYKITSELPERVLVYFVDDSFEGPVSLSLEDLSGQPNLVSNVINIFSVYGLQVSELNKGFDPNLDCEVGGKKTKLVEAVKRILDCKQINVSENKDLVIRIGGVFADRF